MKLKTTIYATQFSIVKKKCYLLIICKALKFSILFKLDINEDFSIFFLFSGL